MLSLARIVTDMTLTDTLHGHVVSHVIALSFVGVGGRGFGGLGRGRRVLLAERKHAKAGVRVILNDKFRVASQSTRHCRWNTKNK